MLRETYDFILFLKQRRRQEPEAAKPQTTTVNAFLARQQELFGSRVLADSQVILDAIIAIAPSSQVTDWQVRDTVEQRAKRGASSDLGAILAAVPDVPPVPGDEK